MTMSYFGGARRQPAPPPAPAAGGNAMSHHPSFMPGCAVYTPGSACVPPATHTAVNTRAPGACLVPRPAERAAAEAAEAAAVGTSIYKAAFQTDPAYDWTALPRAQRPAVDAAPTGAARVVEADRLPPSTYQEEMLGRSSAGRWHGGAADSLGGSASAPTSPAARRGPMAVRPGYLTTAAAAQLPIAERYAAPAAPLSAGNSPLAARRGSGSFSAGGSSLSPGGRPASLTTGGAAAAACFRDPSPATAPAARPASAGSSGGSQPPVRKEDAFLYALDQHSRGRVPGCTLHKPRHNVSLELPPPSKLTTWGAASQAALRRPAPPPDGRHAINSRKGLLGFFAAGASDHVSDQGLAEAARYHETVRPLEGRMRIPQPSATAPRGAKFTG
ncbi:flagellar associated [Chlorella sorokiniana]|uniref:Flagellar associated n=1 Tax=Chlorella sorokiniana TaxID=3076 RepID=A0A2P6TCZ2_CHLSO|nr:flagellar associated [Chlorella sorokiniana]|eukprot:PRW20502.1 flagellar associated [Chlorella sorokiniana]